MIDAAMTAAARAALAACRARGWRLATAESCTGGLVAASLTAIEGSSDVVDRGFVTYSNAAKTELLGVDPALILRVGAVSEEVAKALAEGALARSAAHLAASVTGIAGPGGGGVDKPVGLVWLGLSRRDGATQCVRRVFPGDRAAVRRASVLQVLDWFRAEAEAAGADAVGAAAAKA